MTLFEIIIICIVAAMFVATIFMFTIYLKHIKRLKETDKQVLAMTNIVCECRNFLNKLSKHEMLVRIDKIIDLEKKVGELTGICKNQTNNITQVRDTLDKSLEDIKMRNSLIRDNHKFLDNINVKTSKMKDDIDKIGEIVADINKSNNSTTINKNIFTAYEDLKDKLLKIDQQYTIITNNINTISKFINNDKMVEDITYIREKLGETSVDSEKEVININKILEDIISFTKRCNSGISALIEAHNKNNNFIRESFKGINDTLSNFSDTIDNVAKTNKINNEDIAKISYVLDSYREKINYITTYIENATKLKTASKTKMAQTKTTTTPASKKVVQKYL